MPRRIGLYYPFLEFKDDAWVKLAALYWDKLGRIVPDHYKPQDSDTVRQLHEELGFIINFVPSDEDKVSVGKMFYSMLSGNERELAKRYSIVSENKNPNVIPHLILQADEARYISTKPEELNPELALVFSAKVSGGLIAELVHYGLARPVVPKGTEGGNERAPRFGSIRWVERVEMHPKLAFVYMEALAERMAVTRQLRPVADNAFDHLAVSGYTTERITRALLSSEGVKSQLVNASPMGDEIETQMAMIALQSILPRDIASVPTKKIISLRNRHRDEMTAFQTHIHDLVSGLEELQNINDPVALKAHLDIEYEKNLKPQLADLKKCLKSLAIDTVTGAMNVRVILPPLFASAGASLHLAPFNPIIAGAGAIAFSILPVFRKKQEEISQVIRSTPAAYLLYLQEELGPTQAAAWITQQARRFLFRV